MPDPTKAKVCKDCRAEGIIGKRQALYPGPRCWTHHMVRVRARKQREAEKRWASYSLTPDQYKTILHAQGGGCGFCGRLPSRRRLAVDHDHTCCPGKTSCGKCVRGLLCWTCNKFSEHINDSPAVVARMARYYESPPAHAGGR